MWMVYSRATTSAIAERWVFPAGLVDDILWDKKLTLETPPNIKQLRLAKASDFVVFELGQDRARACTYLAAW